MIAPLLDQILIALGMGILGAVIFAGIGLISDVGDNLKAFGSNIGDYIWFGGGAAQAVNPSLAGGTIDNSSNTEINGPITIQTQATDANGIAKGLFKGILDQSLVAMNNPGVMMP